MSKKSLQEISHPLAYFFPVYLPEGDGTVMADSKGNEYTDPRNVRSIRKVLCRQFALDYPALRKRFRDQGGGGLTPLMLAPDYLLVPVKTRAARCAGDPCYGFFHAGMVDSVEKMDGHQARSRIIMKNGLVLQVLSGMKTVKNMMLLSRSLENIILPLQTKNQSVTELLIRYLAILEKENQG